jgi:RNA polymerase sigma-70 factor (ECF subfamily)
MDDNDCGKLLPEHRDGCSRKQINGGGVTKLLLEAKDSAERLRKSQGTEKIREDGGSNVSWAVSHPVRMTGPRRESLVGEGDEELRVLMLEYQGGSLDAFQEVYARLAPGLRRFLCHLLRGPDFADDLLQETFLQMHRSRGAYNPAYAVRPWVFGLARNVFLMNRRAGLRWAAVHETREAVPDFPVPPEVEKLGSADEIRQCISVLAADRAEALLLHHEWGFTFEEIAGMLGVSIAAARARASRGLADLRNALTSLQRVRI